MVKKVSPQRELRRRAFAAEFAEALRTSGYTLEQAARELDQAGRPVSVATLSYWQNAQTMPTRGASREAVTLLEGMLGLSAGQLSRYLDDAPVWFPSGGDAERTLVQLRDELGIPTEQRFRMIAVHDRLTIGEDGSGEELVRQYMRVEVEQADTFMLALADETAPPAIEAVAGCRVDRELSDAATGLRVAALVLPRMMRQGEQFWLEFRVRWAAGEQPRDSQSRLLGQITALLAAEVVFQGEPPQRAWYEGVPQTGNDAVDERPVPLVGDRLQLVLSDVPAGEHTLHWEW